MYYDDVKCHCTGLKLHDSCLQDAANAPQGHGVCATLHGVDGDHDQGNATLPHDPRQPDLCAHLLLVGRWRSPAAGRSFTCSF